MVDTAKRKLVRFVPGATAGRAVAVFFYLYAAVCVVRIGALVDLATSRVPDSRLGALVIILGGVLLLRRVSSSRCWRRSSLPTTPPRRTSPRSIVTRRRHSSIPWAPISLAGTF